MQQPMMEELGSGLNPSAPGVSTSTTPSNRSYDDLFPALPESNVQGSQNTLGQWNRKMRVGSSNISKIVRVEYEERKFDSNQKFGESESSKACCAIMKETGTRIEISQGKDQSLTFLVTGKQQDVMEAQRKILISFQTQASKQVPIPKEHHRWILGKKGERLHELERQTATKITIPQQADPSDLITIRGPKEGIEKAEHEIRELSDQQSKKASERISIPKIYHPFIVGPRGEYLNNLQAETGAKINVPPQSVMNDEIFIAGDKDGVMVAKERIESIYSEMLKKCKTVSLEIPRAQHRYVIGPKGSGLAEIMQETGVNVEIPSLNPNLNNSADGSLNSPQQSITNTDPSQNIVKLFGPQENLGGAVNMVYNKANSAKMSEIEAPGWIQMYLNGRKGKAVRHMSPQMEKVHMQFFANENKIRLEGPPEDVDAAEQHLKRAIQELIATKSFSELKVDTRLFKHIIGKNGANVHNLKSKFNVEFNMEDSGIIRIEGDRDAVEAGQAALEEIIHKLENEKEADVLIDQRYHRNIIGSKGDRIREIRDMFNQVQITIPGAGEKSDVVKVRGPKEDVDRCAEYLKKWSEQATADSYSISVPIYKQFHRFVIGKGGTNIKRIREETHTQIDLPAEGDLSESINITGRREDVERAQEQIRRIQDELENIVTEELIISPKFYHSLIGTKGKLVHAIMEDCGGVIIKFPTADSKSDIVTIRGPKDDVEKAKAQLLELANEQQMSSYTVEIRAKPQHHKFLIGRNGSKIRKIRETTGARIVFPTSDDNDPEVITIIGRREAVEKAKEELEANIKEIDNVIEDEVRVDPRFHKHFVVRRGEVLQRISQECGGVKISFPRSSDINNDRVVLNGSRECIEAAKARIQEIITDINSMVTIECIIPQVHHRSVMGIKGRKVQIITQEFDVQIKFPDRDNYNPYNSGESNGTVEKFVQNNVIENAHEMNGDGAVYAESMESCPPVDSGPRICDVILITGKEDACLKAKQALLDLVPISIDVDVPNEYHRSLIGKKGIDARDLMDRFDVRINFSDQNDRSDIVQILGAASNVYEAKDCLLKRVEELMADRADRELRSYSIQLQVKSEYHPKIIGRQGAVVTRIRKDNDVQINFPNKDDSNRNVITITGYEQNVSNARDDIMRIVNELDELTREHVAIDSRVHSRLIGARGKNIRRIMDDFKVDIKFPRSNDTETDPNMVTIIGLEENVINAREELLSLEEEYLQDIEEHLNREKLHTLSYHLEQRGTNESTNSSFSTGNSNNGFIVKGAPWEQQNDKSSTVKVAPNTSSNTEFPSFNTKRTSNAFHSYNNGAKEGIASGNGANGSEASTTTSNSTPVLTPKLFGAWGASRR